MSRQPRHPSPHDAASAIALRNANLNRGRPLCPECQGCGKALPELHFDCEACGGTGLQDNDYKGGLTCQTKRNT